MMRVNNRYTVIFALFAAATALFAAFSGCTEPAGDNERVLFDSLRQVMKRHDDIIADKEKRIALLKSEFSTSPDSAYRLADRLFSEYYSYDFDSASRYADIKLQAASSMGDRRLIALSRLGKARADLERGHMEEAVSGAYATVGDTAIPDVATAYHDFMLSFKEASQENPADMSRRYESLLDSGSRGWIMAHSNTLRFENRPAEALKLLQDNTGILENSIREKAFLRFMTARLQLQTGDTASAVKNLLISSIADLSYPVRDYRSICTLAEIYFAQGKVKEAYMLLNFASDDLAEANVPLYLAAVGRLMPHVTKAYDAGQRRDLTVMSVAAGIAALLLILLAVIWRKERRAKAAAAHSAKELAVLNSNLSDNLSKLAALNSELEGANKVKETYILQFIKLCSETVDAITGYRTDLRSILKKEGVNALSAQLSDTDYENGQLQLLYSNFDRTFLSLFPDFVSRFNNLLTPEKRVEQKNPDSLTTELRVFALIRLGITDSDDIAAFLRRSKSTIYNYRVKMRNAAIGNRDDFERQVEKL